MPTLYIGCSGFSYKHWKDVFYPPGLPQKKWLEYYSGVFPTVELNVTFYRLPFAGAFEKWRDGTPPGFVFSVKGSRLITHLKRLHDPEEPLRRFFERVLLLKKKLGVVLWQFPPGFKSDIGRLHHFLELLNRYPARNTFEFRNESWITDDVIAACRKHHAGLCMADAPEFILDLPVTADFVYLRRHGAMGINGDYTKEFLEADAVRIWEYRKTGKDVYIYFNNDISGYAPKNAKTLMELVG